MESRRSSEPEAGPVSPAEEVGRRWEDWLRPRESSRTSSSEQRLPLGRRARALMPGVLGFLAVHLLPGVWLAFAPPRAGPDPSFLVRWLLAAALSPGVAFAQFLALRALGVGFDATCALLVWGNLPAIALVWRRRGEARRPDARTLAGATLVLAIPLLLLAPQILDAQVRATSGHAWMHTDLVYRLAAGDVHPGEPELAGLRVGYGFAPHVQQAAASWWLGVPPASSYLWTNLLWLLASAGFAAALARALAGGRLARITAPLWLLFGVNAVGYSLHRLLPADWTEAWFVWGDYRYSAVLLKYVFFNLVPLAVLLCQGVALLAVRPGSGGLVGAPLALAGCLVASVGVLYPILLPSALAILGARAALDLGCALRAGRVPWARLALQGATLAGAGVATLAFLRVVGRDRALGTAVALSDGAELARKGVEMAIVLSPLLVGLALWLRSSRGRREEGAVLTVGGIASALVYAVVHIPHYRNEYKYAFGAALCLAPVAAVGVEAALRRAGRAAPVLGTGLALLLALPFADRVARGWPWAPGDRPRVDLSSFALRVDPASPHASLLDVLREKTPSDAVIVLETDVDRLHLPTLTGRQLYAPPERERGLPGVGLSSEHLLRHVRGYPRRILQERRALLRALYGGGDAERATALATLLDLGRPLLVLVEQPRRADLARWLVDVAGAGPIFEDRAVTVLRVDP